MTVPEPDGRVVPLDRPFRTEREPVTYEPRRTARHDITQDTFIDIDVAPGERRGHARFLLDDQGRVAEWNAGAVRVTGLTADAVVGRFLWELSEGAGQWASHAKRAFGNGPDAPTGFEDWLWRQDGRRTYVSVSLTSTSDGRWASMRDLTARRLRDSRADALYAVGRAALDAKGVEDLSRRTLEALCRALDWEVGVFWEVNGADDVLHCRRAVTASGDDLGDSERRGSVSGLRLARGEGLAGQVWAKGHPDSTQDGFAVHPVLGGTSLVGDLRSGFAFPIQGGSGTLGVFEFASRAVETPGADLFRTVAIISNHISQFSDRFHAERALRESDAQKAAILSNALDGIIRVDAQSRIVELNQEAERTFGREPTSMLGRDLAAFAVDPEDSEKFLVALSELDRDDTVGGRRIHTRLSRANGEDFPADLSITRIPFEGPTHFSICVKDVSEQERLQDALHHSQKMESLGLLASGIAHDFNNFLTVIRGQAERLVKNLTEDDARRKWVKSILKVSERASALTGQLLAFGRREAGKVAVVNLNSIIESTAGLLSQQLGDAVLWKTSLSPATGAARVGEGQAQQILFNLALNARDAMPDGGTLHVGTEHVVLSPNQARRLLLAPGHYVRLWVKDNGRGMDARTQSRVFEPFFTTKKLGDGTGLGLSTVYAIVQQCGGQIAVSSRLSEGTTFDVYFPRVSEDGLIGNEGPRASSRQVLEGLTVLLVEDDGEIREIIRDTLEENGCNVVEAENGLTALERCAAHDGPIQLLVTDMMMPGMNGHELAERIVRMRPETPVLFVSGHPEAEVGDNTLIGRRVSLLRKPFSSDELVERVAEVVRSSDPGSLVEG